MLTKQQKDQLEQLIDQDDLGSVLNEIADIALAKSTHITTNWHDTRLARAWSKAARRISLVAVSDEVKRVSGAR